MKLYIAGPMRGLPDFNFPAFAEAARILRGQGHEVISPHEKDVKVPGFDPSKPETLPALDFHETFRWDLQQVLAVDAIVLLPGWEKSRGARLERVVAESSGRKCLRMRAIDFLDSGILAYELVPAAPWDHELIPPSWGKSVQAQKAGL